MAHIFTMFMWAVYFSFFYTIFSNYVQIVELVDDETVVSKEMADEYFKEFLPYVVSFYDVSVKASTSIQDVLRLTIQSIHLLETGKAEVNYITKSSIFRNRFKLIISASTKQRLVRIDSLCRSKILTNTQNNWNSMQLDTGTVLSYFVAC